MKKILIVEDNKTLAKLIAKKITSELNFEVEVAFNFKEAKLFLKTYKYFLVLSDLNLPDAPNGEIVDYALKKDNRVIVLTGSVDKKLRAALVKKEIVDYVSKSGANSIDYILQTIERLDKNQNHTVMVVDDSMIFRKQLQNMLENLCFKVVSVAHGEEALNMLQTNNDISLMVVDYLMPVMNGLELTIESRKIKNKYELAIMAFSSNEEDEITALFLKQGANDYITKPFSKEEFSCRVNNNIDHIENVKTIQESANKDFLTGLYNRRYFFNDMEKYFMDSSATNEKFAIAMIDIDSFKLINDEFGHETGDKVIINLADYLRESITHKNIIARFGGEEFCVVLKDIKDKDQAIDILENVRKEIEDIIVQCDKTKNGVTYTVSIGVSFKHDFTLDDSIHEADMMLYDAKQNGKNQIVYH